MIYLPIVQVVPRLMPPLDQQSLLEEEKMNIELTNKTMIKFRFFCMVIFFFTGS
jgi:hypothetical protein